MASEKSEATNSDDPPSWRVCRFWGLESQSRSHASHDAVGGDHRRSASAAQLLACRTPSFASLLILKRLCWLSTQASEPRQENKAQAKYFQQHQRPTEGQLYTVRKGTWCDQLAGAFICFFA